METSIFMANNGRMTYKHFAYLFSSERLMNTLCDEGENSV